MHTIIGIDLAWSNKNPTGLAVATVGDDVIHISETAHLTDLDEILGFVETHAAGPLTIAVDAPTVTHATGMRACEKELQRRFSRVHAGPYPGSTALLSKCNGGVPRGSQLIGLLRDRFGVEEIGLPPHDMPRVMRWRFSRPPQWSCSST